MPNSDLSVRMQSEGAFDGWLEELIQRWSRFRSASGRLSEAGAKKVATRITSHRLPDANRTAHQHVMEVVKDERLVASFWLEVRDAHAFLYDIVQHNDSEEFDFMGIIEGVARDHGALDLRANVFAEDRLLKRVTADRNFTTRNSQMWLMDDPVAAPLASAITDFSLRPMRSDEFSEYREQEVVKYADAKVRSGRATPSEAMEQAIREVADLLPQGLETPGQLIFVAELSGKQVGTVWINIDEEAEVPTAFVLAIEITESLRGRGLGRAFMNASMNECRKRNIRGLALSVFGFNTVARNLYISLGFQVVEDMMRKEL